MEPCLRGRDGLHRVEDKLAKRVTIDIESARAGERRSKREALLGIGLRKLGYESEIGVLDDGEGHDGYILNKGEVWSSGTRPHLHIEPWSAVLTLVAELGKRIEDR